MPALISEIDPASDNFARNSAAMMALLDDVRLLEGRVRAYSERARPRFEGRGQLLPRDRINLLLDRGTPFVELSTLAGLGMHDDDGDEK
ncbi:MAG: acyl-CoA carboxylase subunit beta, partial [Rhodospirillaceae bacterium]|nr:acyl-CoA carboxylase subunit beta [Rhodospirillaceae bacterium]